MDRVKLEFKLTKITFHKNEHESLVFTNVYKAHDTHFVLIAHMQFDLFVQ